MSRLFDAKVDEKRWKVVEIYNGYDNYDSYELEDKKNKVTYLFKYIIGLEQVSEDEFLIYRRLNYDDFELSRNKLQKGKIINLFSKKTRGFHFISDDRILFTFYDDYASYRCGGVYSIKDNSMLEEAKWLEGTAIEIIKDDKNSNDITLYFEKKIISYKLDDKRIIFTVDPNTLQPNPICYSQFRNSYIEVKSKEDIIEIEAEDEENMKILSEKMWQEERKQLEEVKEKVLARKKR